MIITATIRNGAGFNDLAVATEGRQKTLQVPAKPDGSGSSINGGELLFLSLATCFCNDLYREAAKQNLEIASVEVSVKGEFGKEGEPASNITYSVKVEAPGISHGVITQLISKVDKLAEVHNTLRRGVEVKLEQRAG